MRVIRPLDERLDALADVLVQLLEHLLHLLRRPRAPQSARTIRRAAAALHSARRGASTRPRHPRERGHTHAPWTARTRTSSSSGRMAAAAIRALTGGGEQRAECGVAVRWCGDVACVGVAWRGVASREGEGGVSLTPPDHHSGGATAGEKRPRHGTRSGRASGVR